LPIPYFYDMNTTQNENRQVQWDGCQHCTIWSQVGNQSVFWRHQQQAAHFRVTTLHGGKCHLTSSVRTQKKWGRLLYNISELKLARYV
jgi:hypothetical protein